MNSPSWRRTILLLVAFSATAAALLTSPRHAFQVIAPSSSSSTALFGKRGNGKVQKKERVKKTNLPEKICVVCERPFTWRKKWERSWDEVTCCSKACNAKRRGPD